VVLGEEVESLYSSPKAATGTTELGSGSQGRLFSASRFSNVEIRGSNSATKDGSWITLAKEHRELFRVSEKAEHALSLVARHVA
jgi:hypothetical protein